MKINKLKKLLPIAIYFVSIVSWSGAHDPEEEKGRVDQLVKHQQIETSPAGSIIAFAGEIAPEGWLLCDGEKYSSKDYPTLYDVIKTKYIENREERFKTLEYNESHLQDKLFRVPDLRGRVVVGVDGKAGRVSSSNTLGASGGEEKVIMTLEQMPKHSHRVNCSSGSGQILSFRNEWGGKFSDGNGTIEGSGGNKPHNNMQPYSTLNYSELS